MKFVIRSDQKSLKDLLLQVIQTSGQQLYICKLMGYKFHNQAVDALSRRDAEEVETGRLFTALALPHPRLFYSIRTETASCKDLVALQLASIRALPSPTFLWIFILQVSYLYQQNICYQGCVA